MQARCARASGNDLHNTTICGTDRLTCSLLGTIRQPSLANPRRCACPHLLHERSSKVRAPGTLRRCGTQ